VGAFDDLARMQPLRIWDGFAGRTVQGENMTLSIIELDANSRIPEHAHANEQIGVALAGSMRFRIGDETQDVQAGSTWSIPPNVPHEIEIGPEGCVVVEAFAPARDDWNALERQEARAPRWP
jgi:unsaturated pyranuronate lyase